MARRIPPRLLVSIIVMFAVLGTLGVVYLTILAPQMKARRQIQRDLEAAKSKLALVERNFGGNTDPQQEMILLNQEIAALRAAVASLGKISQARLPSDLFPPDLKTDDMALFARRYREHLDKVEEEVEERVKEAYRKKRVPLGEDVSFDASEGGGAGGRGSRGLAAQLGAFYAGGRGAARSSGSVTSSISDPKRVLDDSVEGMANLLVQEDLCYLLLDADIFALRFIEAVDQEEAQNLRIFTFNIEVELSTQSLVRLAYLMREREAYYFFESVEIEPVTEGRGARYFDPRAFQEMDELRLIADITTLRLHTSGDIVDVREIAKERAAAAERAKNAAISNPWLNLMADLDNPDANKEQFGEAKPWWKFW